MTPDEFRTALTVAEGWGTFTQKRQGGSQSERIEIRWGKLRLKTLAFTVGETVATTKVVLTVRDKPIEAAFTATNGQVTITLHKELFLAENDGLEVIIS